VSAKKLVVSTYPQYVLIDAAALVLLACKVPAVTDGGKSSPGSVGKEL
jgi:hypothetical protein